MRTTVRACLRNNEWKYLLVKHNEDSPFTLPGGHIEECDAHPYETLHREIQEELGYDIRVTGDRLSILEKDISEWSEIKSYPLPLAVWEIVYFSKRNGEKIKKFEYIFHAEIISWELKIQEEEIFEYKWFSLEDIQKSEKIYWSVKKLFIILL